MRVLLVYPNVRGMNMLPPAIALFSAMLKERGHKVSLFDSTDYPNPEDETFNSDKSKEENLNVRPFDDTLLKVSFKEDDVNEAFLKHIKAFGPELLAISVTEDMFPIAESLLKNTSGMDIPVVAGGVFPTFAPKLALACPDIDMICVGEGEYVMTELCDRMEKGKPYDDIKGLWTKKGGRIKENGIADLVNMDENPPLDISIFAQGRLYRPMQGRVWKMFPLETHRGCPFMCTYCNSPAQFKKYLTETKGSFFRKKDFKKVGEEVRIFRDKYNVEAFYFSADTFLAYSDSEFEEFVEMYSEFKIPFWCQTRPETITYDKVKKLSEVGLFRMAFGVEHGNQEFRKKIIKRNVSNEKMITALKETNRAEIPFSVNNIIGFPYETRQLAFDTIELNRHFNADSSNCYSFSPFHGTPLREIAEKEGYIAPGTIARSLTRPTMLNMPQFTPEAIEGLRKCFILYVKMPKSRWPEIEKAEKPTPEGHKIWESLRDECAEKYMNFDSQKA